MQVTNLALPAELRGSLTVSIDVEDWHQLVTRRFRGELPRCSSHVDAQTHRLLDLFDGAGITATFFVLGLVAREKPELVKAIAARGHEIASHGMAHVPLFHLSREEVRRDVTDARMLLEDIVGAEVLGYRAPEFSVRAENTDALDVIAEAGYRYDSSIFPIVHRRYGIAGFSRSPCLLRTTHGKLWELPLATMEAARTPLPVAGGGYFRLLPARALEAIYRRGVSRGEFAMMYFHPYEFAAEPLELADAGLPSPPLARAKARAWLALQGLGRQRVAGRFTRVVRGRRFLRARDVMEHLERAGRAEKIQQAAAASSSRAPSVKENA